jgi:cytochrome c biogenesis protein CcdA
VIKKIILISTFLLFVFLINTSSILAYPQINFSEEIWRIVAEGDHSYYTHEFIITNSGDKPLYIKKIISSCSCLKIELSDKQIIPGQKTKLKVKFFVDNSKKREEKFFYVYSNDPQRPIVKLDIIKEPPPPKIPMLSINPQRYDFGLAYLKDSPEIEIALSNAGKKELIIKEVKMPKDCEVNLTLPVRLAFGETERMSIKLKPLEKEGFNEFSLVVESNDATQPEKKIIITGFVNKPVEIQRAKNIVSVYFFYSKDCRECFEVKKYLSLLKKKYKERLKIEFLDVGKIENFAFLIELEKETKEKPGPIPLIYVNNRFLSGAKNIKNNLNTIIESLLIEADSENSTLRNKREISQKEILSLILKKFTSLKMSTVVLAGLLDGINPCALATLIFFIGYLSFIGRRKREILISGLVFIFSVFLTYYLIGIGLFEWIRSLDIFNYMRRLFFYIIIGLSFSLSICNFYDYYKIRKNKLEQIKLKLSKSLKTKIQLAITKRMRLNGCIIAGFASGFIVSLLEFTCTGQIYLPTISFVVRMPELREKALFYLFIYNLMFILPLMGVFFFGSLGVSSEILSKWFRAHLGKIKLVTALFFLAMTFILLNLI